MTAMVKMRMMHPTNKIYTFVSSEIILIVLSSNVYFITEHPSIIQSNASHR